MAERIDTIDHLNKFFERGITSIFGAGHAARHMISFAAKNNYHIDAIFVSSMIGNPDSILGVPVKSLQCIDVDFAREINLLICLTQSFQDEILNVIETTKFKRVAVITDDLLYSIQYRNSDYDILNFETLHWMKRELEADIERQTYQFMRSIKKPCLEYLIFNILDHCNLRCKGCDHFACIADERFYSYETVARDIRRMAEIFHGDFIMKIAIMGGEPLLHPELTDILKEVRNCFPYSIIRLSTNGLLLLRQDQKFWDVCRENKVTIVNTKYPINLDHEGMKKRASEEGVDFQYFEGSGDGIVKQSFKKIINLNGDSDPADSFSKCHISNYGNIVLDGRFYGCPFSVQSYRIFNKKFNKRLRMTEEDYIDIYKNVKKEDFFEFAARPRYYCRYCKGLSPLFPWERSKGKITEWIEGDDR